MTTAIYSAVVLVLVVADQLSKYWAVTALAQGPFILIPDVFELELHRNPGIAFSMLSGHGWIFIPTSILMTILLFVILVRSPMRTSKLFAFSTLLIISGAIGNLIDRIVLGEVIDFFSFTLIDFPIFNFADCCVVVGAILLFVYCLFGMKGMENLPLRTLLFGIKSKTKENDHDGTV